MIVEEVALRIVMPGDQRPMGLLNRQAIINGDDARRCPRSSRGIFKLLP